jgi:hypothetical protein
MDIDIGVYWTLNHVVELFVRCKLLKKLNCQITSRIQFWTELKNGTVVLNCLRPQKFFACSWNLSMSGREVNRPACRFGSLMAGLPVLPFPGDQTPREIFAVGKSSLKKKTRHYWRTTIISPLRHVSRQLTIVLFCSTWQAKPSHVFHLIYYAHTQHHSLSSLALKSKGDRLSWLSSKATASCKLLLLSVNGQPKKTKDADNEEDRTGALQLRSILPILHSRHKRDQWLQIAIAAHNHLHILQQLVCASCKL